MTDRRHGRSNLVLLLLFLAGIVISGCDDSLDMAAKAEEGIKQSLAEDSGARPSPKPSDPRPRLAVDVTLSMAGYIAPPGEDATAFSRALDAVASALPDHELFIFGSQQAGGRTSLDDLLVPSAAGLGRDFATDHLFRGPNNQDDLLFRAVGREERRRPLVLFTDGVYSSPEQQGIQPVALALDELLGKGWSLGVIALRSAYFGTRCELVSGRDCNGGRLFYSEASTQRGGPGFVPLPCPRIRDRPFYVIVLSPTAEIFERLHDSLSERLGAEAGFLLGDDRPPLKLVGRVEPEDPEAHYDDDSSLHWLMLTGEGGPQPALRANYTIASSFPVESVRWAVRAEQTAWNGSGFAPSWAPADLPAPTSDEDGKAEAATSAPERLPWRSFSRDVEDLRASFAGQIDNLGDLAFRHEGVVTEVQEWRPGPEELKTVYCEYLDPSSSRPESRSLAMLRILLATDALSRQQPGEIPSHLGSLLHSPVGSRNADVIALAKDLARSAGNGPARSTTLAAATSGTLPAGRPSAAPAAPLGARSALGEERTLNLSVRRQDESVTYRIRLIPQPLRFSPHLRRLSTGDDSDVAFANRTYRLENLIEYLANAQLERIADRGDLTLFVTVPGR